VVTTWGAGVGDNCAMAFPAIPLVQSFAIGIPVCLAAFAAQEAVLRRRTARRGPAGGGATAEIAPPGTAEGERVTARARKPPRPAARGPRPPARKPVAPRLAALKPAAPRPAAAKPTPAPRAQRAPRAVPAAGPPPPAARPAVKPTPAPDTAAKRKPRPSRAAKPAASLDALRKRQLALRRGLEAIITFVEATPRRAAATACADALLLAVPKAGRGPQVATFLHAAGAKESPERLQELAEEAGVELASAVKALALEIKARAGG
jgi:hypothetical protein